MTEEEKPESYDWSQYGDHESGTHTPLDGTDYVALFIASLQSIFLPLVILVIVLLSLGFIFVLLP
ncbi:MAG: hypothetical protein ACW975_02025 [Candidatus Thorarchaeota archaeon]|jgi:hypothetical protein